MAHVQKSISAYAGQAIGNTLIQALSLDRHVCFSRTVGFAGYCILSRFNIDLRLLLLLLHSSSK